MAQKIVSLSDYRKVVRARAYRVGRPINPMREQYIRDQARNLLIGAWKGEKALRTIQVADMLPVEPRWVAGLQFTDWSFEEPAEIAPATTFGRKVAGVLDRVAKKIEVAASLPHQVRRFTGAHELGHLVLHPALRLLREFPLTDDGLDNRHATPVEREANIFAAELLMPTRLVRQLFERAFGAVIDGASINDDDAFYWTNGGRGASELRGKPPIELAKIVAAASPFTTSDSRPLCEIFDVSIIAMAIQLVDLGLVVSGMHVR